MNRKWENPQQFDSGRPNGCMALSNNLSRGHEGKRHVLARRGNTSCGSACDEAWLTLTRISSMIKMIKMTWRDRCLRKKRRRERISSPWMPPPQSPPKSMLSNYVAREKPANWDPTFIFLWNPYLVFRPTFQH